jgi:hypothetical protein
VNRRTLAWMSLTIAMTAVTLVPGDAAEVVELRLHGHYFAEPATVHVTIAVEPDAQNRVLRIEADSQQMFRASDISLDGADEKRIHTIQFKNLPAGSYTLRAEVRSSTAVRGTAQQELTVTGSGAR